MNLLSALHWRYATKSYDVTRKVADQKLDVILEAIRMAPTSSGLQPFEVLVISDIETRKALRPASWDQRRITDCSHLLVFAAWENMTSERIIGVYDYILKFRKEEATPGFLEYRDRLIDQVGAQTAEQNYQEAARQAYIALGFGLLAAALEGVDSTPIEGFEPDRYDDILGLRALGLRSTVAMCLGYRDGDNDWLLKHAKVRKPREGVFRFI